MWDPRKRPRFRRRLDHLEHKKTQTKRSWFIALITLILWGVFAFIILFIDPQLIKDVILPGFYLPFFFILFFALTFSFYLLLLHTRRAVFISLAITFYLFLRLYHLGSIINVLLFIAMLSSAEFYFLANNKPQSPPQTPDR